MGVVSLFQSIYRWRRSEIADHLKFGPFTTLKPGCFVAVCIRNINVRTKSELALHGDAYDGLDGLAGQALNCCEGFDFIDYCNSRPVHERLLVFMNL